MSSAYCLCNVHTLTHGYFLLCVKYTLTRDKVKFYTMFFSVFHVDLMFDCTLKGPSRQVCRIFMAGFLTIMQ